MKVVVVGATGNVGTSLLRALESDGRIESVIGVARRLPELRVAKVTWAKADITSDDLVPVFAGADAVVHLAWLIQPSHDLDTLARTNVTGSRRVFDAVARAGVPTLVYASSVGAYSRGPKDYKVDESWPTEGIPTSFYSRHKAEVESILDRFEQDNPGVRVVRLRPGLIFKREAGSEVRRLFFGPLLPNLLMRRSLIPVVPDVDGLRFQTVHSLDVGEAYRLALVKPVRGAFNIAADPVLDPARLARLLGARRVRVPQKLLAGGAQLTWRLRLQPTPSGWLDMGLQVPLLDTRRAREELGWKPVFDAEEALLELLDGIRDGAGLATPPLDPRAGGTLRIRELATRVGGRG